MKRSILLFGLVAGVLASTTAMAGSDLRMKGIGGAVGYVSPENVDGTFSIGALADLGTIAPHFALEGRLDYWSHSEEALFGANASIHDITLGGRMKYMLEVKNSNVQPFVGTGLGFHFIDAEVTTPAFGGFPETTASDSDVRLGLDLGGGIVTPVSPRTNLMGEMWFGIVSDVSQFSIRFGLCHQL